MVQDKTLLFSTNQDLAEVQIAITLISVIHPDLVAGLRIYESRLEEAISRVERFGGTNYKSDRYEAYDSFVNAYHGINIPYRIEWEQIKSTATYAITLQSKTKREREAEYAAQLADQMRSLLSQESADDIMYVPLHAIYIPFGEVKPGRDSPNRSRKTKIVGRLTRTRDPILLVRGLPGTGKSVALRQATQSLALHAIQRPRAAVPIFVPLGQIIPDHTLSHHSQILTLVETYLRTAFVQQNKHLWITNRFLASDLRNILAQGRCVVFFDGMDELPRAGYDDTCRVLTQFAAYWTEKRDNRFIFSCREFDYPAELRLHSLMLMPFSWNDVSLYLRHHLPAGELTKRILEARQRWESGSAGQSMLDNPFYLHLVSSYIIAHPGDSLPTTRGELFVGYVDRVFRRDQGANSVFRNLLRDLALWITENKTSGTSARWSVLRTTGRGKLLIKLLQTHSDEPHMRYFIDYSDDGITFRHHKLREFFAAEALAELYFGDNSAPVRSTGQPSTNFGELRRYIGDIWFYETIVILSSLLQPKPLKLLIDELISVRDSYRSILAAECLEASPSRGNGAIGIKIFDSLRNCLSDPLIGQVGKVECWHAMRRLGSGGVRMSELSALLDDESRFVREEALQTVGRITDDHVPGCDRCARGLILGAATLGSIRRLYSYRSWVFSKSLSSTELASIYVVTLVTSFVVWLAPAPMAFFLGLRMGTSGVDLWVWPATFLTITVALQLFLALNEDKRQPTVWAAEIGGTLKRAMSVESFERARARRAISLFALPALAMCILFATNQFLHREQELASHVQQAASEGAKYSRLYREAQAKETTHVSDLEVRIPNNINDLKIEPDVSSLSPEMLHKIASQVRGQEDGLIVEKVLKLDQQASESILTDLKVRYRVANALDKVADELYGSFELGYLVDTSDIRDLVAKVITENNSNEDVLAKKMVDNLRQVARQAAGVVDRYRYDRHAEIPDRSFYDKFMLDGELRYISGGKWAQHVYLAILFANGFISKETIDKAEKFDDEIWLANQCGRLVSNIIVERRDEPVRKVPREAMRRGFAVLESYIGSNKDRTNVERSALEEVRVVRDAVEARALAAQHLDRQQEILKRIVKTRVEIVETAVTVLLVVSLAAVIAVRYIIPRIQMWKLDVSSQSDARILIDIAKDGRRDSAMRESAIRSLALSDDQIARKALERFGSSGTMPEALVTAANRALHAMRRRQMRRG